MPTPVPVPTDSTAKSSTPWATPPHCSPTAARLTSFSNVTGKASRVAERLREALAAEPDDAAGEADHVPRPDHARHADDGRVDQVLAQPRRLEQRPAHLVHDRQHARRVGTVQLDVLARADGPGEVGDGGAQVAGADVDAEHDRGVRHRLEEHGAVARPVRPRRGLAHQPGLDQRPQRAGDGRLGDARLPRHLRAGDRCRPADHVQHGALVERPQQRRGGADGASTSHIGRDFNEKLADQSRSTA